MLLELTAGINGSLVAINAEADGRRAGDPPHTAGEEITENQLEP
jgi:hypothetical protein